MPRCVPACLVALAALAGCGGNGSDGEPPSSAFDGDRALGDLTAQVHLGPRPAGSPAAHRTAELIARRMREAGLEGVEIQSPWENVVGTIPGSEAGTVVVGAHYDTKSGIPGFVGANDGASGVAVLLELARALPNPLPGPAVQLVAFDAEEARGDRDFDADGTRGSRQYVADARRGGSQGAVPLREIRAMVLFDMVGDCDLRIPLEQNSDPSLYRVFGEAATEATGEPEPFVGRSFPVGDDHVPFLRAGVPAVDLIDFDYGPGPSPGAYWHTTEDTVDKVCPESLDAVGETALVAIPRIR
jgi:Zn-dependent M28 family amino/carboxypeptidase